jgi:hypothetical protein
MKRSIFRWGGLVIVSLFFTAASAVWGDDFKLTPLTHLNGISRQIIKISTACLENNNTRGPFFYDRPESQASFVVPKGFSFVITDIIISPFCLVVPSQTGTFLVLVDIGDGTRNFTAGFVGTVTQHYHLTGGIVVPEETSVAGRNTTDSSTLAQVELLGYFVRGPGLGVGEPFPFPDH